MSSLRLRRTCFISVELINRRRKTHWYGSPSFRQHPKHFVLQPCVSDASRARGTRRCSSSGLLGPYCSTGIPLHSSIATNPGRSYVDQVLNASLGKIMHGGTYTALLLWLEVHVLRDLCYTRHHLRSSYFRPGSSYYLGQTHILSWARLKLLFYSGSSSYFRPGPKFLWPGSNCCLRRGVSYTNNGIKTCFHHDSCKMS